MNNKEKARIKRNNQIDELKADVDRIRNTAKIVDGARVRASYLADGKLHQKLDKKLEEVYCLLLDSSDAKIEEVNSLTYKNMGENVGEYEGSMGTRRRKR